MTEEKKMQALDDEELDNVSGGKGAVISKRLDYCPKCGRSVYESDMYMTILFGGKTRYYHDKCAPKEARAPGKSC